MLFRTAALIGAMLAIIGCAPAPTMFDDDPRQWGAAHQERIRSLPLLGNGGVCDLARGQANALGQSPAQKMLVAELRNRGLTGRDVEIISNPKATYGTQMTFNGLSCALRLSLGLIKSFYSGIGHAGRPSPARALFTLKAMEPPKGCALSLGTSPIPLLSAPHVVLWRG